MRKVGKAVGVLLVYAICWVASLAVMLVGGYIVAVGTPCLCADVNGFLLGGGLVIIVCGAAMLLWSRDIARLLINRVGHLAGRGT